MSVKKNTWIWSLMAAFVVVVLLIIYSGHQSKPETIDLLSGYDWNSFAGAKQVNDNVVISPLNRQIVGLETSTSQSNAPVNLAGPNFMTKVAFELDADVSHFGVGDSLSLYGGVPIIYDEWRYEPPSVTLTAANSSIQVTMYDGKSNTPRSYTYQLDKATINNLRLARHGQSLAIYVNDRLTGSINAEDVLNSGKFWIGTGSSSQEWQLRQLTLMGQSNQINVSKGLNFTKTTKAASGLHASASKNAHTVKIGAAVSLNPLLTDSKYRQLALDEFGMWTTENELKPQFIHPGPQQYSFQEADLLINTAVKNNIAIHGHTLVFGEANPKWMTDSQLNQRRAIMTEHITTTVNHFKDRVHEWDVVNEPLSENDTDYNTDGLRHHIWYQAMGEDYIAIALQTAHQADPTADLYINDYGLEADGQRWDAMLSLITKLQAEGAPLSGIGFESHIYEAGDEIDQSVLSKHFNQLAKLGLKVRISEIDVHGEDQQVQVDQYVAVLESCLSAPNCVAYSSWGISDKYGSTTETGSYPPAIGDDLLWDYDFTAKPAYWELAKILGN